MVKKHEGFVGFAYCPVCKQVTRHYRLTPRIKTRARIYCDICRVVRYFTEQELEDILR